MNAKKVRDVMLALSEYATVSEDATLREAIAALDESQPDGRHSHRAVLVLDRKGRIAGKLTLWAVLRALEEGLLAEEDMAALYRANLSPDFIRSMISNLPMPCDTIAGLCRRCARKKVKDIMVPAKESIDAQQPLGEAIRLLVLTHAQSMLVTDRGIAVGILRLSDVFEEVANAIRSCPD